MITSLRLDNARIFEDAGWEFPLAQLGVICGTNSAGKSTLLKTFLLLRQSLGIAGTLPARKPSLKFSGTQVDFGDYATFISHNQTMRDLHIGISLDAEMPSSYAQLIRRSESGAAERLGDEEFEPYSLSCDFYFGFYTDDDSTIFRLERSEAGAEQEDEGDEQLAETSAKLKRATFEILLSDGVKLQWEVFTSWVDIRDARGYSIRLPRSYVNGASGLEGISLSDNSEDRAEFATVLRGLMPDRIIGRPISQDASTEVDWQFWPLPTHIERAHRDLRRALTNVNYLGPLRSPAKRFYTLERDSGPVDLGGEFLPNFLRERSDMSVTNLVGGESQPRRESLGRALDGWLYYLRTGSFASRLMRELSVSTIQDVLIQVALRTVKGTESHALADSGFGYSQVLPILARGLITSPGGTFVVEQPELHLNPALQVRVATFLVSMARAGKQILIETHSEHIVNAIRVLAAEEGADQISRLCRILFIDSESETRPQVHELSINADGTVPEWPRSFFGEAASLAGRLLRMQMKKHITH